MRERKAGVMANVQTQLFAKCRIDKTVAFEIIQLAHQEDLTTLQCDYSHPPMTTVTEPCF